MNLKTVSLSIFIAIFGATPFSQTVKASADKKEYKINEIATVSFEIKLKFDSTSDFIESNFLVIQGPERNTSHSITNGKEEYIYEITYQIKATRVGKLVISSPRFYAKGKTYSAYPITLNITGESLTAAELHKAELDKFRENYIKPKGTLRYVLSDSLGYIEMYNGTKWDFVRELTKAELQRLSRQ